MARTDDLHSLPQDLPVSGLHLPFELLSDARRELVNALTLPTFEVGDMTLVKRLTLIVKRGGRIVRCFYPVFPPDTDAARIVNYLRENAV
jgi:peroxiredoxin